MWQSNLLQFHKHLCSELSSIIRYEKNPRLPKGIIVKNTHRSIYPLIMLLRNAEGRFLYLILKDIDVVFKKGIKRY